MRIGILGTGDVGQALGKAFVALGHEVKMGSRNVNNEKMQKWAKSQGAKASTGTFSDAATYGDLVVVATLGLATEEALNQAGPKNFAGKIVMDVTNPLDMTGGNTLKLTIGLNDSLGERVQRMLPQARVVKAFNTVGNNLMFRPDLPGGPPDMFIAGNDDRSKRQVAELLQEFGWGTVDVGNIEAARYLEPMCMVWLAYGMRTGTYNHAFKMLRR